MNSYETMYILRSDLLEEQVQEAIDRYRNFLAERGADGIDIQVRGKRRLAYPIQNQFDGIYVQMNYKADGSNIAPMERAMRLSEDVLRYLTMTVEQPEPEAETVETAEVEA